MEEDTSGFYKYEVDGSGEEEWRCLFFAPNFVWGPNFNLDRNDPEDRTGTTEGWTWYDSRDEAIVALQPLEPYESY